MGLKYKTTFLTDKYIKTYNTVIPNSLCKSIIDKFEADTRHEDVNSGHKIYKELNIDKLNDWHLIKKELYPMFQRYALKYGEDLNIHQHFWPPVFGFEQIRIKKYLPNDKDEFKLHVDVNSFHSAKRFLVMFVYLNDVEEGGETYFSDVNYAVKPEEAKLLMFPPHWTYPHAGNKVSKGVKYILGTYLHYIDPTPTEQDNKRIYQAP